MNPTYASFESGLKVRHGIAVVSDRLKTLDELIAFHKSALEMELEKQQNDLGNLKDLERTWKAFVKNNPDLTEVILKSAEMLRAVIPSVDDLTILSVNGSRMTLEVKTSPSEAIRDLEESALQKRAAKGRYVKPPVVIETIALPDDLVAPERPKDATVTQTRFAASWSRAFLRGYKDGVDGKEPAIYRAINMKAGYEAGYARGQQVGARNRVKASLAEVYSRDNFKAA